MVQSDVPGKPRRSRGVPGSISGLKHRRTGPKIFSKTAFRYPARGSTIEGPGVNPPIGDTPQRATVDPKACSEPGRGIGLTTLTGYLKAVWQKIFEQVLLCFRPEIDPGTP